MPSSYLILGRPLLLLPPISPSIRVFSNESTLHMRWPQYWNFSFSIIPSKEIRGLISFRKDWLDLLAVQGTLKSLLQHRSSKAPILRRSSTAILWIITQFSSVAQLCPTLCNLMDYSVSGLPVHHKLLELDQTHVHKVGDAIKPSHPLSASSPPTFNLSQHQGLFK